MRPSAQLATARALRWRQDFQAFYDQHPSYAPEYLRRWCSGAKRSRLQPIKDFVTLVENHWDARRRLACQPSEQRPARRDQLPGPGRQSPSPRLPQQNQDDHHRLPHRSQTPTTHRHQPHARLHVLTLSNPLKTAKSPERTTRAGSPRSVRHLSRRTEYQEVADRRPSVGTTSAAAELGSELQLWGAGRRLAPMRAVALTEYGD